MDLMDGRLTFYGDWEKLFYSVGLMVAVLSNQFDALRALGTVSASLCLLLGSLIGLWRPVRTPKEPLLPTRSRS